MGHEMWQKFALRKTGIVIISDLAQRGNNIENTALTTNFAVVFVLVSEFTWSNVQ